MKGAWISIRVSIFGLNGFHHILWFIKRQVFLRFLYYSESQILIANVSDYDTAFALSKVLKRLLSYSILLHEYLRLSCLFLITVVETKTAAFGKSTRKRSSCFSSFFETTLLRTGLSRFFKVPSEPE